MLGAARYSWVRQVAALLILLALWEAAGYAGMLNPLYLPSPSQIGAALMFALIVLILAVVLLIFGIAGRLEKYLLRWQ